MGMWAKQKVERVVSLLRNIFFTLLICVRIWMICSGDLTKTRFNAGFSAPTVPNSPKNVAGRKNYFEISTPCSWSPGAVSGYHPHPISGSKIWLRSWAMHWKSAWLIWRKLPSLLLSPCDSGTLSTTNMGVRMSNSTDMGRHHAVLESHGMCQVEGGG